MEIISIEKISIGSIYKNNVLVEVLDHKLTFEHNGLRASFNLMDILLNPKVFSEELTDFRKTFFKFETEDWTSILSQNDIIKKFASFDLLFNPTMK